MKVLITGSQGFVGHNLYRRLEKMGLKVFGVDKVNNKYKQNFKKMDLTKEKIKEKFDLIFHLASDVGGANYINGDNYKYDILSNNMKIDLNIVEYCKKKKVNLVYFSSSCATEGQNTYGISKNLSEELILNSGITFLIVRPQNIYGPGDRKRGVKEQVIMALFRKILHEKEIILWNGRSMRSFIHVEELLDRIFVACQYPNHIEEIGGEWITIRKLAEKIMKVCSEKKNVIDEKIYEKKKRYLNFKKTEIKLMDGLKEVYDDYINNAHKK